MLTQKEQETKAFLKMAEFLESTKRLAFELNIRAVRAEQECAALRAQLQELEKQLYGSR
jgi:hypothetical protein